MQVKLSTYLTYFLFIGAVCCSMIFSTGMVDTGDGIAHFNISKYSWNYPELLLDHWGKPLFTLLSSPFAQIGIKGLIFFNLICALLTGRWVLRAGSSLGIENRWLILLCLFAAPVYFKMVIAGLTEILFAMLCAWSISLILKERYKGAAIILSFLPFARPEAYVVVPFFALFIAFKHWRSIPWLLTGSLVYSLLGLLVFNDALWLINRDPYAHLEVGVYGFGNPLSFLNNTKNILGIPISIIFVLGAILVSLLSSKKAVVSNEKLKYWLLLILPAIAILVVHSYLWWKGLNGSAGLSRVIATSAPMVAIVAGAGLDRLSALIAYPKLKTLFMGALGCLLCFTLYDRVDIIVEHNRKQLTTQAGCNWLKEHFEQGQRLFYLDPLVGYEMGLDPYDKEDVVLLWSMGGEGIDPMQRGDILFWETHFAPQEGGVSKSSLLSDTSLEIVFQLAPEVPYPIRDQTYEVMMFRKR